MESSKQIRQTETRREFIGRTAAAGLGFLGLGVFLQSCAEKEVRLAPSGLAEAYLDGILNIVTQVSERESDKIARGASMAVQAKLEGRTLYADIIGNMYPQEVSETRPGSPHIFQWTDYRKAAKGDLLITNNPDTARGLGEQSVRIIGITTPSVPNYASPPDSYENMGVFRIEDVADIIIDCHVPYQDGILNVEGIEIPVCPASGIVHSLIYYALVADIVEGFTVSGIYPQVG